MPRFFLPLTLFPVLALGVPPAGDLAKRQCRSVHLQYRTPPAKAAYMEVTAEKSAPGTYFCALGFAMGYFGMQELADGKTIVIFSVWEPGDTTDAGEIPEDRKVRLIEKGEGVMDQRFGGEGTGGQSRMEFPWKTGEPVKFLAQAKPTGDFTEFTGRVFDPQQRKWRLMATFRTLSKGIPLKGIYSFVEDFRRNYESAGIVRKATFQNGWILDLDGKWRPMENATFTADPTPSSHVDAGVSGEGFFLQTGGETENHGGKLWQPLTRHGTSPHPMGVESLLRP